MKSNFRNRIEERNRPRVTMHKFNARVMAEEAVQAAYRREEDKRLAELEEILILAEEVFLLAAYRVYGFGAVRGHRLWKAAFEIRKEARESLRAGGRYEEVEMGKNAEDLAIREELRKIGIDVREWLTDADLEMKQDGAYEMVCPNAPGKEARRESKEA